MMDSAMAPEGAIPFSEVLEGVDAPESERNPTFDALVRSGTEGPGHVDLHIGDNR